MNDKRDIDELSVEELEQLLYLKRRSKRLNRLKRLKAEGRIVEIDHESESESAPAENGETLVDVDDTLVDIDEPFTVGASEENAEELDISLEGEEEDTRRFALPWRPFANRFLLVVEIAAVVALFVLAYMVWQTTQELNEEIAEVQKVESASVALPTPTATPVIGVVVLPSGHKPPVNGSLPVPGEAGEIPEHLLPIIDSYIPPPVPTPGPEQARRIQIPAIDLDKPIVQGDTWEQLKKGVGQHIGTGLPGEQGNIVLSAHNDIYGEIFRHLDQLGPGDEIIISTERRSYSYVIRDLQVVDPTDVWVMSSTDHSSTTLISCYPYLVNNKRIVVFADLASLGPLS